MDMRTGEPQNRFGRSGEEKILSLPGLELRPFGRPAHSQPLYRLCYSGSYSNNFGNKTKIHILKLIPFGSKFLLEDTLAAVPFMATTRRYTLQMQSLNYSCLEIVFSCSCTQKRDAQVICLLQCYRRSDEANRASKQHSTMTIFRRCVPEQTEAISRRGVTLKAPSLGGLA
jgi:hypothetical protein